MLSLKLLAILIGLISSQATKVRTYEFGRFQIGHATASVRAFELSNQFVNVTILSYGATVQSLQVRDRMGQMDDIVTGYNTIEEYFNNFNYDGAILGRYANRIGRAEFFLDNNLYKLNPSSWDKNHIHGGTVGFDKKLWSPNIIQNGVEMWYSSPDGEEGFPGTLDVIVMFTLVGTQFTISYEARTSKPTVVSLSHHNYFNLNGHRSWGLVDDLHLTVQSTQYLDTDEENVPTGILSDAFGTAMDLSQGAYLTQDLLAKTPGGYGFDNNYCFADNGQMKQLAILASPRTGRLLEVRSTLPGLQVYTANWNNSKGKQGAQYVKNTAVALEPQYWPDSPNHANFPSTVLLPGQRYSEAIQFNFYQI